MPPQVPGTHTGLTGAESFALQNQDPPALIHLFLQGYKTA